MKEEEDMLLYQMVVKWRVKRRAEDASNLHL